MSRSELRRRLAALPGDLRPLYAGTVVTRLGTYVVPYLTLYLSEDRGLSLSSTGRVIAAGGVGLLLGNIAGGWLSDRVGCKRCLLLALAVNAAGVALLGVGLTATPAYAMALALALTGAGMYTPAANAWIAEATTGDHRQLAYTVNYICINIGMGLGPLLGGLLAATSFRWLFAGDVLSTILCAIFIASASAGSGPRRAEPSVATQRQASAPRWRVLTFCAASFFVTAPLMGLEYVVPLYVGTVLREPLVLVGLVYTVNAGCILALGLPLERMLRRRDPGLMMVFAGLLWAVGLAMLAVGSSARSVLVSTVVWTVGEMIGSVVVPTFVSSRVPAHARGRYLSVVDAMRSLAGILAPIGLGWVWERSGVDAVMRALIATPLLGAGLYSVAWLHGRLRGRR